jgi:hypothetical protein
VLERYANRVKQGIPPTSLIGTKFEDDLATTRRVELTRPLRVHQTVPRYSGKGDPNDAANFRCAAP